MPACYKGVLQYKTYRIIRIQSVNYGTIKWILHAIVFSYISFALVTDKLYQKKESVISSVHTKVKGLAEVKDEIIQHGEKKVPTVFDTADYTFSLQGNSFFVMTNFLRTKGQQRGVCAEYPTHRTLCQSDKNCRQGWMDPQSKGIQTGKCVVYKENQKTCEVNAWCPTEATAEVPRPALLNSAENFTVFIKNNIDFPSHNFSIHAKYYTENGVEKRTLTKVFGIRFDILVFGTGGKFHIISLIVYIGSTLSYFGLVRPSLARALRRCFCKKKFH
ncbi:purinergic receptor P2X 7 [Phyllostomus discolor]|uniref:Purinergic receptor P2X 7 n=1 Tax=Phyllostomus discolor TaxID=89673 RepID=A0A833YV53_9CHIR|nr:purinergic receptor P2X 7 [Phyllostomus discolor]